MSISLLLITYVVFSIAGFPSCFSLDQLYEECLSPLKCGSSVFPNITYPFWGINKSNYCGQSSFQLSCEDEENLILPIGNLILRVISKGLENQTITVADESWFDGICPATWNFTGDNQFTLTPFTELIDLFDCSSQPQITSLSNISCDSSNGSRKIYHLFGPLFNTTHGCTKAGEIPMLRSVTNALYYSNLSLEMALKEGFDLRYTIEENNCRGCMISEGICGSESGSGNFQCLCEDKPHTSFCTGDQGVSSKIWKKKLGIGLACGFLGITLIVGCLLWLNVRKRGTSHHPRHHDLKALIQLKQYSYADLKKITKSFSYTVGKGGFGTVYGGKLCDGRKVAVKILKDFKSSGEDFINEVASMSQTSHVNIVSLLGFCYEGSKRAIVYEFLANGSLDQFISSKKSLNMNVGTLYEIALGVARGLEYLHHGCKTRIVHFDIKPQNVLLDDNLCPKVSDFGLARLCEKRESIISLLDARGTIGYIAPEMFSRMYGRVSHKSDVYSYGMLLLEMIGERNKEPSSTNSSSAYFPDWIYKDLENGEYTWKYGDEITTEEKKFAKKMTLVGLWCVQPCPSNRPAMNKVVEMMEGSLDALGVPPKSSFHFSSMLLPESSSLSDENSNYTKA